jgi:diguanylate cyclase (GGDEF)-like protein
MTPSAPSTRPVARVLLAAVLLLVATLINGGAHLARAACLELSPAGVRALQELSGRDPKNAIEAVKAQIDTAERAVHPDEGRIAALYAVEAQAYTLLELDEEARSAALKGLELAPIATDSTHLSLQIAYAENVYDSDRIDAALSALEKARSLQLPGSRADLCLQIVIGEIQNRRGRADLAILTLTQAYRAAVAQSMPDVRVQAASVLSPVMRTVGDFKQALALNQEAIDWELKRNATLTLSVLYYLRGQIFTEMRDYQAALEQMEHARHLSVDLEDVQGIGFADLATCQVRLELQQLSGARTDCANALRIFTSSHAVDSEKAVQSLLARLDLAEGHPDRALVRLNEALSQDGAQLQPRQVPGVYKLRAQVYASLQKYAEAYRDLSEYSKRYTAGIEAERAQQVASLRARFETDREIERNSLLQRELALADERGQRQKEELRWVVVGGGVAVMVIALLTYLLVINRRYRRRLVRLASEDSLTGLPNRGRIAGIAQTALMRAFETRQPLCIALIDLDRFKAINDRFGHAAGDRVLQDFASMAQASLRPTDTLGRWGGEEFLLVLPDTTLDVAVGILDHLRLQAGTMLYAAEVHPDLRVSISAGLAMTGEEPCSLDEIVAQADHALYEAKNSGRDLVRYAAESFHAASTAVRRALRERTGETNTSPLEVPPTPSAARTG